MISRNNEYLDHPARYAEHDAEVLENFSQKFKQFREDFYKMQLSLEIDSEEFSDFSGLMADAYSDCIAPSINDCRERLGK
tara:strand:- start:194 stop:433 length:240 start_codon:yes stop_codon:yes gene_type:complete